MREIYFEQGSGDAPRSVVSGSELEFIISQLHNIRLFLETNTNLTLSSDQQLVHTDRDQYSRGV